MKISATRTKLKALYYGYVALGEGRLMAELIICIRGIRVIRGWY